MAVQLTPFTKSQWFASDGTPLAGGKLFSFAGGTSTPLATFTDSTGGTPNANPIILDAAGRADVWLTAGTSYKLVMQDSTGVQIWSEDGLNTATTPTTLGATNIAGNLSITQPTAATGGANQSSFTESIQGKYWDGAASQTDQWTLQDVLGAGTNPTSTLQVGHSGSPGTASVNVTVPITLIAATIKSLNGGGEVYADQYTDVQTAINALPATGGICWANSPNVNKTLGAIDAGSNSKPVTLILGPFTYTFTQIIVRQGFNILGAGLLNTVLQNVGTNANPAFIIPQVSNNIITIHWADFQVLGLAGNTSQDGIFFDGSTLTNAGVDLSTFTNLQFTLFKGATIHLKATQDGASGSIGAIQGLSFFNVTAIRPTGATGAAQNALRIEGGCGQIRFDNCWFTGASSDTGTNVVISTTGTQAPYSIHFNETTNQNGFAYLIDGSNGVTTEKDHFEVIKGCYNFLNTASPVVGFKSTSAYINSNVAVNAGNGYIVNVPAPATSTDVLIDSPLMGGQPDKTIVNAANGANVRMVNAQYQPANTPTNVSVSSGSTFLGTPAATLDIKCARTVQLSASGTSITTLKSGLQPGETVTFYTTGGTAQFATGGNISLGANTSPLVIPSGDSATFMRVDAGVPAFVLAGYSRGTNALINTSATGAGSGNSITLLNEQGPLAAVVGNGTPLTLYSFTIPANTIQAGKGFKVTAVSKHTTGTGAVTYTLKVGSTTIDSNAITSNANVGNDDWSYRIFNNTGVQNAQHWSRALLFIATATGSTNASSGTIAENFANALAITYQMNAAGTEQVTPLHWLVELVQ